MNKIKLYIILTAITATGLFLRFYHNLDISLWHDEAFSALLIKYPWGEMFYRIGLDVHPPVYYIVLRLWSYVAGNSLLALRGFSILFGLFTSLAAYGFVKAAFKSEKSALITALLISTSPFQIQYATEARMYTFGAFLAVLAAYFLVKALEAGRESLKTKNLYYALFGIVSGLATLTHYYLLFSVAALCLYALCYHIYYYRFAFKKYLSLLTSYLLLIAVFLPWLKWFLFQYKQVGSGYWIPPLDRWSIPSTLWQMLLGIGIDITHKTTQVGVVLVSLFTLYFLYRFIRSTINPHKWLVILALGAPFGGAMLFAVLAHLKGENSSVYLVRYFLYASTFYTIALAVWFTNFKRQWLAYVLLAIYVIVNLSAFTHYWKELDVKNKSGMAQAAELLSHNAASFDGNKIFVGSSFEFFNLKYYLSNNLGKTIGSAPLPLPALVDGHCAIDCLNFDHLPRPLLYSGGNTHASNLPHFAGTAILTDSDLLPKFADGVKQGDTVWLLWTNGFGGSKPEVPKNWTQVEEKGFAEVRPYVGTWVIITKYIVQ